MARVYRFFTKNIAADVLYDKKVIPLHLTEKLEPEIFFQLVKVLRTRSGDEVILIPTLQTAPYFEYRYEIENVEKKEVVMRFMKKTENTNEAKINLSLLLCLPNKPDKLELILQKAVELGAGRIVLLESDLSQMKHSLREDRLEKIILEAAEQCERAVIPELITADKLQKYLKELPRADTENIFVALEREFGEEKRQNAFESLRKRNTISLLIGPEGGFSEEEKKLFSELRLKRFSLGKRILRMETAAILSLGLAMLLSEDRN